jgi:zinc transport system ATP-binding protein
VHVTTPVPELPTGEQPTGEQPIVEFRNVSIGYEGRAAVHGVSLAVRPGEVVAIVGPNGSGKSTLVRGMLGLADVLHGRVLLFGQDGATFADHGRVGYVPQRHTVAGAIPSTVSEVVASGRLPRKRIWERMTRADRLAVRAAIDEVGLGAQRKSPVGILSGGQQRRVLIARALASEPDVLVMDEPTAGVDVENQQALATTLARLAGSGHTMIIVTHELEALSTVVTRVVSVGGGRVTSDVGARPGA